MLRSFPTVVDKRLAWFLIGPLIVLMFLPKVNLLKMEGHSSGLRIDDLLLAGFGLVAFGIHYGQKLPFFKVELWLLLFVFVGCFSALINAGLYPQGTKGFVLGVFYSVRPLEYFLFFYVGILAHRYMSVSWIMRMLWSVIVIVIALQSLDIIGAVTVNGINSSGYVKTGIASFSSEMGALLNVLFCYSLFSERQARSAVTIFPRTAVAIPQQWRSLIQIIGRILFFCVITFCQLQIGNRTSLAILCILLLGRIMLDSKALRLASLGVLVFLAVAASVYVGRDPNLGDRSANLFQTTNVELVTRAWDNVSLESDRQEEVTGDDLPVDMSWWMRIHKWCFAIKHFIDRPIAPFVGVGPGFCGAALDGGVLRVVIEYGLLGVVCFSGVLLHLWNTVGYMKWVIGAVLLNMIFFDAHLAYKLMSIFFFIGGVAHATATEEDQAGVCC